MQKFAIFIFLSITICLPIRGQVISSSDSLLIAYVLNVVGGQRDVAGYCEAFAHLLVGTPYSAGSLDRDTMERLHIDMQKTDCTIFAETVLALSRTAAQRSTSPSTFINELQRIRYRNGIIDGYISRLHYMSEWIADNEHKGIVTEVSRLLGGKADTLQLHYMSRHANRYPMLTHNTRLADSIAAIEQRLSGNIIYYIPTDNLTDKQLADIQSGDIVLFTCDINGLDIAHVGIATRRDGEIYIVHASSSQEMVVIEQRTLKEQLVATHHFTGIRIVRPNSLK